MRRIQWDAVLFPVFLVLGLSQTEQIEHTIDPRTGDRWCVTVPWLDRKADVEKGCLFLIVVGLRER
jgi:hypothetical protein